MQDIFEKLSHSKFRSRFKLSAKDKAYVKAKGMETIETHARDFIAKRVAPAIIENDGKQTPMKNHPVFVAQHATACCCRKCISKWHGYAYGTELSQKEQDYLVSLIMRWIRLQME